jgi:hypothetical protein
MKLRTLLCLLLAAPCAWAAPYYVEQKLAITSSGQQFNYQFAGLPTAGSSGSLGLWLNGDYSGNAAETATLTVDGLGGALVIGDSSQWFGVSSDTIAGVEVSNYASSQASPNDALLKWEFSIDNATLAAILADGSLSVVLQNSASVAPLAETDEDYAWLSLWFLVDEPAAVPAPGSLALCVAGLAGLAWRRRRPYVR